MQITTVVFDQIRQDNFAKLRREIIKDKPSMVLSNTYCNLLLRGIFVFWDKKDVPKHWKKNIYETFELDDREETIKLFTPPKDEFTEQRVRELEKEIEELKKKKE